MPEDLQQQIDSAAKALTAADVDYDATMAAKTLIARSLFDRSGAALLQVCSATLTDGMLSTASSYVLECRSNWLDFHSGRAHLREVPFAYSN